MAEATDQELDELRKRLESLQKMTDEHAHELEKYRDFWAKAWPEGLRRLDRMTKIAAITAIVFGLGGYFLLRRLQRLVEAE